MYREENKQVCGNCSPGRTVDVERTELVSAPRRTAGRSLSKGHSGTNVTNLLDVILGNSSTRRALRLYLRALSFCY